MSGDPHSRFQDHVSRLERRPVLRPAGNTTAPPRRAVTSPSNKSTLAKAPKPDLEEQSPVESHQDAALDEKCYGEEKNLDSKAVAKSRNLPSKRSSTAGKSLAGRGNVLTQTPSMGILRFPNIETARSPWSSIGSTSSEEVSSIASSWTSEGKREVRFLDISRKLAGRNKKQAGAKVGKVVPDVLLSTLVPAVEMKKRCGWITSQSDPTYVAYHDIEWGVPVHDDRKLFELLVLVGVQSDLSWPVILSKREMFRAAFDGFDAAVVAKFDEKKIACLKADSNILQQESKIRGIINNASRVLEITEEFGSFGKFLWGFVNHKPIVSKYRYPKQVPVKTPKSELISKELLKRGFRFVGPTVVYSLMQAMGMSNDHLVTCFRHKECSEKSLEPPQQEAVNCTYQQIDPEFPDVDDEIFSVATLYEIDSGEPELFSLKL